MAVSTNRICQHCLKVVPRTNFSLEKGNILGLLGHNGAGKSTLINCLIGQERFKGRIEFNGISMKQYLKTRIPEVSIVPDQVYTYDHLSGIDFIKFALEFKGQSFNKLQKEIEALLVLFEIQHKKLDLCKNYSLGIKKKFFLTAMLASSPKLLILDEPTNGLDVRSIINLREYLRNLASKGTTIVLTSHNLEFLSKVSDRVILLKCATSPQIIEDHKNQVLEELFLDSEV